MSLAAGDDVVLNPVVFGFGDDAALHQIVRVIEGAVGDDAIDFAVGKSWKRQQIFARGFVDVDRVVSASHAFLHAVDYGLGVATHGFGGLRRLAADFVGVVFGSTRCKHRKAASQQQAESEAEANRFHRI